MKLQIISFALLCITLVSCDNDKNTTETTTTTATPVVTDTLTAEITPVESVASQAYREGTAVGVRNEEVPDTIKNSFVAKYPTLKRYNWFKYEPVTEDEMVMDDTYYYVKFNNDGADYTTWFNNRGEWVKTATKVSGNKNLTDPVNQYINTNYPGYTIEEIQKENDKNTDMYEIKMYKGDRKVKLKILPNGKVFKRKTNA